MIVLLPAAVLLLVALAADSRSADTYLTAPGLRLVKDPAVVIPAAHPYPNRPPPKPVYRDKTGRPAPGWRRRYIDIRRFASNHSAWLYYRDSDLDGSETVHSRPKTALLRIWPPGATLVLENYRGDALAADRPQPTEILVMHKMNRTTGKSFYPAAWSYARFNARGAPALTSQKLRDCHQCHSIAFHLTGDLIFSRFP